MILYNKQITKALIRLCGWAGWSAPLLFVRKPLKTGFLVRGPYYFSASLKLPDILFSIYNLTYFLGFNSNLWQGIVNYSVFLVLVDT